MDLNRLDQDPLFDLILRLTPDEFMRAARIGGHLIGEAAFPNQLAKAADDPACRLLLHALAVIGLRRALHDSYDRHYPRRYPDDLTKAELAALLPPIPPYAA